MTWARADFRTYPARCSAFHLAAAANYPEPVNVGAWRSLAEATSETTLLRKFRFLVRTHPGIDLKFDQLMASNSFRTRLILNALGDWTVLLYAKPAIADELLRLNPELDYEI